MFYVIYGRNLSGEVVTQDGIVTQASRTLLWAHGKRIDQVLGWARRNRMTWSVSAAPPEPRTLH